MSQKMLSDINRRTGDYGYSSESRISPGKKGKSGKRSISGVLLALLQLAVSVYFMTQIYMILNTTLLAVCIGVLVALFAVSLFTQMGKRGVRIFGKIFAVIIIIILIIGSVFSNKVIAFLNTMGGSNQVDTETPFIVFVSASDDFGEYNPDVNGRSDTNILAVVNPKTYTVLMVSTPRDYYVHVSGDSVDPNPDSSFEKLTHVGLYGSGIAYDSNGKKLSASEWGSGYDVISSGGKWGCPSMYGKEDKYTGFTALMNTLQDLYGFDIDRQHYSYVRLNFTGFGRLIDAMGGITVKVDEGFTTRTYANYENDEGRSDYTFQKGKQELNGIEALTYARERHKVSGGDMGRNKNQIKVIKAMASKMLSTSTFLTNNFGDILDSLGNAFTTNLDLTSLVKFQTAISTHGDYDGWEILSYSVTGTPGRDQILWDGSSPSVVYQDETSISNASNLIKMTLEGRDSAAIKTQIKEYNK